VPSIIVAVGYLASFGLLALAYEIAPGRHRLCHLGRGLSRARRHPRQDHVQRSSAPVAIMGMVLIVAGVVLVSLSGATSH
jgi:hypothetical protein